MIKGAHLNTLFHSKTGNLIRGEDYSKSFDEDVITRLNEAKKGVNSELKYLNEKLEQCKDMFCGVTVEKQIKKNITETTKEQKKKTTEKVKILNCVISFCQQTQIQMLLTM